MLLAERCWFPRCFGLSGLPSWGRLMGPESSRPSVCLSQSHAVLHVCRETRAAPATSRRPGCQAGSARGVLAGIWQRFHVAHSVLAFVIPRNSGIFLYYPV